MSIARYTKKKIQKQRNPTNLTQLHLQDYVKDYGFTIGDYSYGAPHIRHYSKDIKLTVGRFCSFADNVFIFLGGNHHTDWVTTYPFSSLPKIWPEIASKRSEKTKGDVVIGSDVWLGSDCTILSGVTIGHGAVIGARAVVAKNVAPYSIVVGNPAREIRKRFSDPVITKLLKSQWWLLERKALLPLIPLLQSDRIEEFLTACANCQ
jgi:acetyltransferase-like isoleucine patch superfamily enzyme